MSDDQKTPNGWNEWSKYVLKELERLSICYERLDRKADETSEKLSGKIDSVNEKLGGRLTLLQVKVAGIAVGSSILTSIIFMLLTHLLKWGG